MSSRYIYLIRNGQYDETVDEERGAPLTEDGRRQAALTAKAMGHLSVGTIYCSPHQQLVETAEIIAQAHADSSVEATNLLRQYDSLIMEGDTLHPALIRHMFDSQRKQLEAAFSTFFRLPTEEKQHDILVCPSNLIRDLICRALDVSPETWAHMLINHCGISIISIDDEGKMELGEYNNVRHLPESLRTDS